MKKINQKAPVVSQNSILIHAPIEKVWEILTSINNWQNWNSEITSAKLNGNLKPKNSFVWKSGGIKITSEIHTVEKYHSFGWTGKSLGTFAIHNWKLTEKDQKTQVVVEESMQGFLVKVFKTSFQKNLDKNVEKWLISLKNKCE